MTDALSFLYNSNQTAKVWIDSELSIPTRIAQQAEQKPSAIALTFEGQHLTYAELNQRAAALAGLLMDGGVQPGDLVGLMLERSFELVIALLAVLKAGAAYVPLDLSLPHARLRAMLDDCQPVMVLHRGQANLADTLSGRRNLAIHQQSLATQPAPLLALPDATQPSDLIYAIYTSGSTGMPKAALNEHGGVLNRLLWLQATHPLQSSDAVLQKTPSSFDVSVWEFFWPLMVGARLVLARPSGHMDPLYLAELMVQERITVAHFVPTMLRLFLDAMGSELPPSMRLLFFSGEALPADLAQRVVTQWPGAEAYNYYGPTECAVDVSYWDCRQLPHTGRVLIGHPLANTRLYILDEQLQPVAPGTPGELFIAGVQVGRGYLNRPELTAEKFLPDAFASQFHAPPGARMYRTGDVACWHVGQGIEYLGRTDFQVKVNGVRIELGDIESAIMATGQARQAVAMAQPLGMDGQRLIAVVVPHGCPTDPAALLTQIQGRLPAYMVPSALFEVPSLPTTSSGKTDRNALLRQVECEAGGRIWPSVPELLQRVVQLHPERIALQTQSGHGITYRALEQQTAQLAHALQAQGVMPGDRVALMMDRSVDVVLAMVAVTRIGAIYAPIDTKSPPDRQRLTLEALQPALTLTALDDLSGAVPQGTQRPPPEWSAPAPQSALCIMFTSGSTGQPKGVVVPHEGVARLVHGGCCDHLRPGARWAWLSSPAFDASHLEIWGPLLNGGTCVLPQTALPSLDELAQFFRTQALDAAWLTAALFNALVDHDVNALGSLQQLLTGGERLSHHHVRRTLQACPALTLINGYGPTEGTTFALTHHITTADCDNAQGIPIGKPIRATAIQIDWHDADHDVGELIVGGPGVALGYLGQPHHGPESPFFNDGPQRWYRTGDLVRLDTHGVHAYVGRKDHQVKIQGHRIEIDEVERQLLSCPGVSEAIVVSMGERADQKYLAAAIKTAPGTAPSLAQLQAQLRQSLPEAAVPRAMVTLVQMPLGLNGKADRHAVQRQIEQHLGQQASAPLPGEWPTPTMATLAQLWAAHLPAAPQSPEANFLACGGTSMGALQLAAAIRTQLNRSVAPGDLLLKPALHEHAALVEAAQPPRTRAQSEATEALLTEQQKTLVVADHLDPTGAAMLVHVPLMVAPGLDRPALKQAFGVLVQRHPMLRVAATLEDGEVQATLLTDLPDGWWQAHGHLPTAPDDLQWPSDLLSQLERRLDTRQGPFRVDVWDAPQDQTLVVWTLHHYAIDEASTDVCLAELDLLLQGETLPPVHGSPFAFAGFEQAWMDHDGIERVAQAVVADLGHTPAPFASNMGPGREPAFELTSQTQDALAACCQRLGCTPFAPLLAAYGAAVQDTFGTAFKRVLAPFSRRMEPELIEPANYFLDVRLMEAGVRPGETPQAHLARVYRDILSATAPSFQPLASISTQVAQHSAPAARALGAFAITWRHGSARPVPLGARQATLLRCPHRAAKFGVTLHAALIGGQIRLSIEAVNEAFDSGAIQRLFEAFESRLQALTQAPDLSEQAPSLSPDVAALRSIWQRWTSADAATQGHDPDFLLCGGSSLSAIRMSTQIKQQLGVSIQVGDFLARPRFSHLVALIDKARQPADTSYPHHPHLHFVGNPQAPHLTLLIPGYRGFAVGMLQLAQGIQAPLGPQHAVAIVDLETLVQSLGAHEGLPALEQQLIGLVQSLGPGRLACMAGFSLGGQLALRLAQQMGSAHTPMVCLLDTYVPSAIANTLPRRLTAKLVRAVLRWLHAPPAVTAQHLMVVMPEAQVQDVPNPSGPSPWARLLKDLECASCAAPHHHVWLIQAAHTLWFTALLRRRGTNGFDGTQFKSLDVYRLPAQHLEVPKGASGMVASVMAHGIAQAMSHNEPPKLS